MKRHGPISAARMVCILFALIFPFLLLTKCSRPINRPAP